jgi:ISXO2 transposase-like protein
MGYVKMIVMDELTNVSVNYELSKHVEEDSHIVSDMFRGFSRVNQVVRQHTPEVVLPQDAMKKLPWVHTTIANCKRELLGVHHSVTRDYLQTYLNEFCYKLNRRNFKTDLFDRMLICGGSDTWY